MNASFDEITIPEFLDIVLAGGERADEAMYYLLHRRIDLRSRYEMLQTRFLDDFDDIVDDFFLYLRDGKDGSGGDAYQSLRSINKRESFETWMLNTFRNYLTVRAAKEKRITLMASVESVDGKEPDSLLTDEHKLAVASHLIAYAHQSFAPRERFILLRILLTLLNRQQAMPNDRVAQALGMSAISYRVAVHRIKVNFAKIRARLLCGEEVTLDAAHQLMSQCINDDFTHLYPSLFAYYCQSIESLSHADDVKQLRQEYLDATGLALHEIESRYSIIPSISSFWTMLSRVGE